MPKLTKRTVDQAIKTAKDEHREVTVSDSVIKGFQLRVKKDGTASYYLRYTRLGKRERASLGKHGNVTADEARTKAEGHAKALDAGEDPKVQRKANLEAPTMERLAAEYMAKHAKPYKASWEKDEQRLRLYVLPELGRFKVKTVDRQMVKALLTSIGIDGEKPGTANKVLALLSKMFSLAVEWGYRLDNPCKGLTKSAKKGGAKFPAKQVHRYLDADEVKALMAAVEAKVSDPVAAAGIRWILLTGQRHDEALTMRWSDVDLSNHRVKLITKTGDQWRPISKHAAKVLRELDRPEVGDAYVFASPRSPAKKRSSLNYWWNLALDEAGIGRCRVHDLRHTAASLAAAGGASLSQIGAMLGHKSAQATYMYAHLVDADVRRVADGVGDAVAAALAATPKVKPLRRPRKSS